LMQVAANFCQNSTFSDLYTNMLCFTWTGVLCSAGC
jgi:hypothetical protein